MIITASHGLLRRVYGIALYAKDGLCTHAARRLPNGLWTSKLGYYHDIQHSTPQSLEGYIYGKVYCYMNK